MYPKKINLANIPTPIQKMTFGGCSFTIKRDDLTGVELTGNKVRKLEYLLFDAKKKKSNIVFTTGGEQSNHARATVIAAKSLGLKSKLFLWGKEKKVSAGNLFMDKVFGADIKYLTREQFFNVEKIIDLEKIKSEEKGLKVYSIPAGGSSPLGIWGYINFMSELNAQMNLKKVKGIFAASGSGGTAAGMLVGAALLNINLKIFAVNVLLSKKDLQDYIFSLADQCVRKFKLNVKVNKDNLEILDGYSNEGYKNIEPGKIEVIKSFAHENGILLDPTYTGKAFYAFNELFLKGRKKSDIMFLHTGGIYGVFAKMKDYLP